MAGRGMGLLCASIYAFSPLAVLSAELVRMYSLAGLLSAAATFLWIAVTSAPASRRTWLAFIAVIALGSFVHVWFISLVAAFCAASLIHFPRRAVPVIAAISTALLPFTILWLPVLLSQMGRSGDATAWLGPPTFTLIGQMLLLHLGVIPVFLLFFLSMRLRRRKPLWSFPWWAITLYAATLLPALLVSFWFPFFYPRFTIVALPALAWAVAALLSRIEPVSLAASIAGAGLLLSIGLKLSAPACDARSTAVALQGRVSQGEVVVYGSLSRPAVDYYLDRFATHRAWREQSFPSVIDSHPGYEGRHLRERNLDFLRSEAMAAAADFARSGALRVYYLAGYRRQIDDILIDTLSRRFSQPTRLAACSSGDYFREILVFERRPGQNSP